MCGVIRAAGSTCARGPALARDRSRATKVRQVVRGTDIVGHHAGGPAAGVRLSAAQRDYMIRVRLLTVLAWLLNAGVGNVHV